MASSSRPRLHQEVVDHALVLPGDVAQLARQRVDDVKVRDGQKLRFPVGQPSARRRGLALRAMPVATRVVGDVRMAARRVLAARHVTAERPRAAALDRAHDLQLVEARLAALASRHADRARGGCPRAPNGRPWPAALSRRGLPEVPRRLPVARRDQARDRALDLRKVRQRHLQQTGVGCPKI